MRRHVTVSTTVHEDPNNGYVPSFSIRQSIITIVFITCTCGYET